MVSVLAPKLVLPGGLMQGLSMVVATASPKMSGTQSCDLVEYLHLSDLSCLLFKVGMLKVTLPGVIVRG